MSKQPDAMEEFEAFLDLQDYYEKLQKHDWFHYMSDDGKGDRAGAANYRLLLKESDNNQKKRIMLEAFENWIDSIVLGKPTTKPARPT